MFGTEFGLAGLCGDIKNGVAKSSGDVASHGGYMELKADTVLEANVICARCGEEFPWSYTFSTVRPVTKTLTDKDNGEYIFAEDSYIDLTAVFEGEVLLELPAKLLCEEECKGLCAVCGFNLNKGICGCTEKVIDPRLEALKAFLQ